MQTKPRAEPSSARVLAPARIGRDYQAERLHRTTHMEPATARRIGNIALFIAVVILVIAIAGRFGLMPPVAHIRELSLLALVLAIVARVFRRRGQDIRPSA